MSRKTITPLLILVVLIISGCATIPLPGNRYQKAEEIAQNAGMEKSYIKSGNFTLTIYSRIAKPKDPLMVYVEGDGLAYLTKSRVSMDPTPADPVSLRLAAADPSSNVAYIARPGQYCRGQIPECDEVYWTKKRFSDEVIRSVDKAVSELKKMAGGGEIDLVGFSGGGAVVCLVAAIRNDAASIRTVAGNLDPDAVNKFHKVSPLEGSLNPMDIAGRISGIPQRHFIGGRDTVIPPSIAYDFAKKSGDFKEESVTVVSDADHHGPWNRVWGKLLEIPLIKPSGINQ